MRICSAFLLVFVVACALLLGSCSSSAPPTFACSTGTPADGRIVGVVGFNHKLRVAPDAAAQLMINQTATKSFGKTQYQEIDNSTQVRVLCRSGSWAKVKITQPKWLQSVSGWVQNKYLLLPSQSGVARKYTASDILWDKYTKPYKAAIVQAVNRIHRSNAKCMRNMEPSTVDQSSTKSRPGKPVFFVTCGRGNNVSNVYFTVK